MTKNNALTRGAHHIGLTVPSLEKTRAFFLDTLGFEQVGEVPDYPAVFVSDGSIMITLWQAEDPGVVISFDRESITLIVRQSFGNCPQYIQAREPTLLPGINAVSESRSKRSLTTLNNRAMEIIRQADNFYIATHYSDGSDNVTRGSDV